MYDNFAFFLAPGGCVSNPTDMLRLITCISDFRANIYKYFTNDKVALDYVSPFLSFLINVILNHIYMSKSQVTCLFYVSCIVVFYSTFSLL